MKHARTVALCFSIGPPYIQRIIQGVLEYAEAHGPWDFAFNPETALVPIDSLRGWDGDGILGMFTTPREIAKARALGMPVVSTSGSVEKPHIANVTVDNLEVGRLAAAHLLDNGFRRFGYYGLRDHAYGYLRGQGFAAAVQAAGFPCSSCFTTSSVGSATPWQWDREQLVAWLKTLQPPVGVFTAHDYRARLVAAECAALGLRIPEDVALLGVNDDPVACNHCRPPLSSIALPGLEVGRRAAAMLDRLMRGKPVPARSVLIKPEKVVTRGSTETFAIDDALVARAFAWIDEHLDRPVGVAEIARALQVSRRLLELRFESALGRTPHAILCRKRVERAGHLLRGEERMTLKAVAARCGFSNTRHMNLVFGRVLGVSPRSLRVRAGAD